MNKIRALTNIDGVGKQRFELYKKAYDWINHSIKEGFYLESIALIESLIADRLESRLSFLSKKNFAFKTLERIISKCNDIETDPNLKSIVLNDLVRWKDNRNKALHEMVKIEKGTSIDWDTRRNLTRKSAKDGLKLLRIIDNSVKKLQTQQTLITTANNV